jgi:hypothetical protein
MAFVSRHHAPDYLAVKHADEEKLGLNRELARDVIVRVVPGTREVALLP